MTSEISTELLENASDVLREAISALECWGARGELEARLKAVWFELHQVLDPHCSCSDCCAAMEEPDGAPLGTRYTLPADEPTTPAGCELVTFGLPCTLAWGHRGPCVPKDTRPTKHNW